MKVLMLSGSRNPEGQTARAAGAMVEGVLGAGAEVEQIFLPTLDIGRCNQCEDSGWGKCREQGRCALDDDFDDVLEKLNEASAVIFATPVYYSDLSESMRALTDRLRRICTFDSSNAQIEGKAAIGVCVAGGGGGGATACCVSLEQVLTTCGFDVVDMVPVRRQNLDAKLPGLRLTGEWLTSGPKSA